MNRAETIPGALAEATVEETVEFRFHLEEGRVSIPAAELAERAHRGAQRLVARGVQPGDIVGILGPNRPEWLVWAHATWIAGAAVAPMQIPLRIRDPDAYAERLRSFAGAAGCRLVLADPRLAPLLPEGLAVAWEEAGEESAAEPEPPSPESTAVIQFTSGSTASPKGVVLPHRAMTAQLSFIYEHYYAGHPIGSTVSWAPFFHDLGLVVSVLLSTRSRSPIEILPTELFAADPAEWLRLLERTRALGTLGPSSAFGAAMRAAVRRGERVDLSSLLVAHFAAEGVDPAVARRMAETGVEDFGLPPEALGSTYGLAEAVLGVSYSPFGGGMKFDRIALDGLAEAGVAAPIEADAGSRLLVSCGRPVMEVRIADDAGEELAERQVGEILVRGPSLMSGYLGEDVEDPFVDGWLRTGDMGYLADGELYVTGRAKDMVIAMGQNYYPEDFEWAAGRVSGVREGRCAAFVDDASGQIVVLAEPAAPGTDLAALRREVSRSIADAIGVRAGEVLIVPRGTVEKTTSGKLRRTAMRQAYAGGEIAAVGAGAA